jgi:Na+-transporting NADH:ubiquinone oxidoreductase subunit NqrB
MTEQDALDDRLGALLRGAERAPDEAFVARVDRALAAERSMEGQRRAAWGRFGTEAAASAAVGAAFVAIGRAAPAAAALTSPGPLSAAGLLLILWLFVAFRPAAAGR